MSRRKRRRKKGPYRHREYGPRQAEELLEISEELDRHLELERAFAVDLEHGEPVKAERRMSPEEVMRVLILTEINRWTCEELEYPLAESQSYRRFSRTELKYPDYVRAATMQAHFDKVSSGTLELLHEVLTNRNA